MPDLDALGRAGQALPDDDPAGTWRAFLSTPAGRFAGEPRDEAFAVARERELRAKIEERLRTVAPGLPMTRLECRTRTCAIDLAASSRLPDAEVNAALDVFQAPPIADGVMFITGAPDAPTTLHVYLEYSREAPPLIGGDAARMRSSAPVDWTRFVRDHPTESSALTNAVTQLWRYQASAAFVACGAPARTPESPRYVLEGEVALARARATLTGWACLQAPAAEQAICECLASWLAGDASVALPHGDPAVEYRGGISVLL